MLQKIGNILAKDGVIADLLGAVSICVTFLGLLCLPGLL